MKPKPETSPPIDPAVSKRLGQLHAQLLYRYGGRVGARFGFAFSLLFLAAMCTYALLSIPFGYEPTSLLDLPRYLGAAEIPIFLVIVAVVGTVLAFVNHRLDPPPTRVQAALYCEAMEGSPGSVELAASGVGGPEVAAHAAAALDATLRRPAPSSFGRRRAVWLAVLIVAAGVAGLSAAYASRVNRERRLEAGSESSRAAGREASATLAQSAGADVIASLRDQMLAQSSAQRAESARRYAERMRDTRLRLDAALADAQQTRPGSDGKTTNSETRGASPLERARSAAAALATSPEFGSAGESALKDYAQVRDGETASDWLEQSAPILKRLSERAREIEADANTIADGGSLTARVGASIGSDPQAGGVGSDSGALQRARESGGESTNRNVGSRTLVLRRTDRPAGPVVAAQWSSAAALGARYLAALDRAKGGAETRPLID